MKQHFLAFLVGLSIFTVHFEIFVLPYLEQHRQQISERHVLWRTYDTTTVFPCPLFELLRVQLLENLPEKVNNDEV